MRNAHALQHIYERFVKAVRDAPLGEVELYMHGTHESNVDLILESSLLKERCVSGARDIVSNCSSNRCGLTQSSLRKGPCFWFTPHLHDANNFMHGTKRLLVCAIICYYTGGQCGGYKDAVTIVDEAHVLPVLELQIA